MLGFQTSEDYENAPPSELPTRRPFLLYRGSSTTPHQIQKIPPRRRVSTTPAYEFGARRSQSEFDGVGTNEQQHSRPPVRVLVTKRPLGSILVDPAQEDVDRNSNLISRRQLESRDNQDVYSSGRGSARPIPSSGRESRYDPAAERPYQREVYRNLLLEQNNLKPDYIPSPTNRGRYYSSVAEEQEEDYPDVPAVVPMVNRVLGSPASGDRRAPSPRFARPPPSVLDENAYPVPAPPILGRRQPYRGLPGARGYAPAPYSPQIDYESLREEIMNYLIQYIQYRMRGYIPGYGGYSDPVGAGGYYQPRPPLYQQDYYNQQRYYPGRFGSGAIPPPVPPQAAPPLAAPRPVPGFGLGQPPVPQYADFAQPGPIPPGGVYGRPPFIPGGYNAPVGPAASYPYINPNVQYSDSQDASGSTTTASTKASNQDTQASETLNAFKARMDASDHRDASDTRPPSPGLIRTLLARPGIPRTQLSRPTIRSVQILGESLGTAATENRPVQSSTTTPSSESTQRSVSPSSSTTADPDPMIASA
ncbi:Hypothetical protein NTJ_05047 [Nesidiocoris tenuis]|uniref:Uncharacterized protein n=1 Tax=Nesidiocoris tenuis TaxID=355587 RepID=A0ABN7ALE7_9HEMI|nr:Hypothetical protein NTJ_05047 [Nesidiocoris tenuis]